MSLSIVDEGHGVDRQGGLVAVVADVPADLSLAAVKEGHGTNAVRLFGLPGQHAGVLCEGVLVRVRGGELEHGHGDGVGGSVDYSRDSDSG